MNILPARPSNADEITSCVSAAYEHYIERMGCRPGPMLDDYAEMIDQHSVWVMHEDDVLAAVLVLIAKPDYLLLDNVAVSPEFQGKGLGRRMMKFAEIEACQLGYKEIVLYTHELMHENIALYKRIGYDEFERKQERGFDRVYMRKQL